MSGSKRDDQKTKKELIAELEKLRGKLPEGKARMQGAAAREPALSGEFTRRDALKIAWVTPVILSVPLGSIAGVRRAHAGTSSGEPTQFPTSVPTLSPSASPSLAPTAFPSVQSVPAVSGGGAAAAAAVLFGFGAKAIRTAHKSGKEAVAPDESTSNDGSEDDDGSGRT